jgi:DNA-binding Xre family transcriptional regulator
VFSYEPLFKTLERKNLQLIDVEKGCGFSSKTTSKFRKNKVVNIDTLARVCRFLKVPIQDVVYVATEDEYPMS